MRLFVSTPSTTGALGWLLGVMFSLLFLVLTSSMANGMEQDKQQHVVAGCAIATVAISLMDDSYTPKEKFVTAVAITSVVGLAKELNDRGKKGHTYDVMDALATSAGSMVCAKISINF